jgi:hypothetical protein
MDSFGLSYSLDDCWHNAQPIPRVGHIPLAVVMADEIKLLYLADCVFECLERVLEFRMEVVFIEIGHQPEYPAPVKERAMAGGLRKRKWA